MALTAIQSKAIKTANARLKALLKAAETAPSLLYSPAVEFALEQLGGETTFKKETLKAAQRFNRRKTSKVKEARKWSAQTLNIPAPAIPATDKAPAMTSAERSMLRKANARLQRMRQRGDKIPKQFEGVDRFRKSTKERARLFLQFAATVRRPHPKPFSYLTAAQGQKIASLIRSYKYSYFLELYDSKYVHDNFSQLEYGSLAPRPTGAELAEYAKNNSRSTYSDLSDIWNIIKNRVYL